MPTVRRLACLLFFLSTTLFAQDFRVTAPERAVQIRVQVLYPGGTPLPVREH